MADAERRVRRHIAGERILSFVPDQEQRLWRTITRTKQQLRRDRVRLQNQLEGFPEEVRIKLSSHVSDLPGLEALRDALSGAVLLNALQRQVLKLFPERLVLLETRIETLDKSVAEALRQYQEAVRRLAEVPGPGADSAQQMIAEVGPQAATFPSAEQPASWVGCCPWREESAEVSRSNRSRKGNRFMRHLLNQAANAAIRAKGSVFEILYRRLAARRGHHKAVWAVAHRMCRIIWKILHQGVAYEERGPQPNPQAVRQRTRKLVRDLRRLGYQVGLTPLNQGVVATALRFASAF